MSENAVTIEGSVIPSTFLARGQRRTVARTEFIEKLISNGYVVVIDPATAEPVTPPQDAVTDEGTVEPTLTLATPGKGDSRDAWAEFIGHLGIEFPEDASRGDLIALWEDEKARA